MTHKQISELGRARERYEEIEDLRMKANRELTELAVHCDHLRPEAPFNKVAGVVKGKWLICEYCRVLLDTIDPEKWIPADGVFTPEGK